MLDNKKSVARGAAGKEYVKTQMHDITSSSVHDFRLSYNSHRYAL